MSFVIPGISLHARKAMAGEKKKMNRLQRASMVSLTVGRVEVQAVRPMPGTP
ncbi:MAG TPA: hypothetical protein VMJ11_18185 [Paraburkholderia sp.]|uniref:hypothetical protein n=1 Tax=Paraburkholderia sp. TaxID=1926495 RepID=UPI002C753AC5|nr:hypothetical protein [Paraburkholderia sp.]HTR08541.1 hypothetical protein [Paraburkholderia sp.]